MVSNYFQKTIFREEIYDKRVQKVRWHLTSGQKAKTKQRKKKCKKDTFFVVFFSLLRDREAKFVRDEICTFSIFGVHVKFSCVVKKTMIFHTFLVFISFPTLFYENKMHDKLKKNAFFGILPYITQQKKCEKSWIFLLHENFTCTSMHKISVPPFV